MQTVVRYFILLVGVGALFLLSTVDGSYICNPDAYVGKVMADKSGGYRGECVSFVKVFALQGNLLWAV